MTPPYTDDADVSLEHEGWFASPDILGMLVLFGLCMAVFVVVEPFHLFGRSIKWSKARLLG